MTDVKRELPPRMIARHMKKKTLYYYTLAKGRKIPLGSDLNAAKLKWAELENGSPQVCDRFEVVANRYKIEVLPSKAPKTQRDQVGQLQKLCAVFGQGSLSDIEPQHIRRYLDKRTKKTAANREIALFSHLFNWARGKGYTNNPNPCVGVKKNPERPSKEYINDADYRAVLSVAPPELADAMEIAYLTGQRVADVLKITRKDISDGCLWITQNKTQKPMGVRISGKLATVIDAALTRPRSATGPYIVQTDNGQRLTYTMLRKRFLKACEVAGVKWKFKDIRAKAATDSESLQRAQELLGHEDPRTTKRSYRRGEKVDPLS